MYSMNRRLKKAEDRLSINRKHWVVNIAYFGGGECPSDRTDGNITIRHVKYEDIISDSTKGNEKQQKTTNSEEVG